MKKFGFPAILALALVFGLTFVSCNNDSNYDRTIEELFNKVKADNKANLVARISDTDARYYCIDHQIWEMQDGTPATNFNLATDAVQLQGWYYATTDSVWVASIPRMIKALNSFYSSKYKTPAAQYNATSYADGTKLYGWYSFFLNRNGSGGYGGKAGETEAPCMADRYLF